MRRVGLALVLLASCVTATRNGEPSASQARLAEEMSAFSGALARAGMSVPLPPRICAEPSAPPRWDEEIGCLDVEPGDSDVRRALTLYARAIVKERLPEAPPARAEALVDAYLKNDSSFPTLALQIERELDERRARKARPSRRERPKRASPDTVDAGVVLDGGPAPDGGEPADAGEPSIDDGPDGGSDVEGTDAESDEDADEGDGDGDDELPPDVLEVEWSEIAPEDFD